jgi:hypothetical protein
MDLLYRPNRAEQDLEGPVSTDGPPAGRAAETDSVGLAKPVTSVEDPS